MVYMKFIRINSRPRRDLARGFSYSMGEFGNPDEAHAGLSGYSLESGTEDACEQLEARMGFGARGNRASRHARLRRSAVCFVTLWEGTCVGTGPDGEDLFRPTAIVRSWRTTEIRDAADLAAKIETLN